jgi:hypothetical protein
MIYVYFHVIFYYWFGILIMNIFVLDSYMSPCNKPTSKSPVMKAFTSGRRREKEPETPGVIYDDTTRLIEKGGTTLKWG